MKYIIPIGTAGVILMISGCASVLPTTHVDLDGERAEIQAVFEKYGQAVLNEDLEMLAETMAQDTDLIAVGTATTTKGWEAFRMAVQQDFSETGYTGITLREQVINLHSSGDVAWFYQVVDVEYAPANELPQIDTFRLTGVLENRDGHWQIVQRHLSRPSLN